MHTNRLSPLPTHTLFLDESCSVLRLYKDNLSSYFIVASRKLYSWDPRPTSLVSMAPMPLLWRG